MLRTLITNSGSKLFSRASQCQRGLHTATSSGLSSGCRRNALVAGRAPLALVAQRTQQRRSYAMPVEESNKGVVSTATPLRNVAANDSGFRTRMIPFSKAIPPTISTRCTWHGSKTQALSTCRGRLTFTTWRRAICQYPERSSLLQA